MGHHRHEAKSKKGIFTPMEQAKPAMKAEINLFRARDKNSRSNFAMNSALIRDISGRERLNFIDIILSFMCMGVSPCHLTVLASFTQLPNHITYGKTKLK